MTDNCKHVSKIKTSIQLGILSPEKWHCQVCHTTESVWACLSCSNFACGRYIAEHALHHYKTTGHPLCIEVNEKFVFCYVCDDFVLNDNAPGDIKLLRMALDAVADQNFEELFREKRGRRILRFHLRDTKRAARRLLRADDIQTAVMRNRISRLSWALRLWWTRFVEKKRLEGGTARLRASSSKPRAHLTCSPAFTGLRNLGNTCYMNSVLQVLRHTAPFANFILNHPPSEILPSSKRRRTSIKSDSDEATKMTSNACSLADNRAGSADSLLEASVQLSTLTAANNSRASLVTSSSPEICMERKGRSNFVTDRKLTNAGDRDDLSGGLNGGRCNISPLERNSGDVVPTKVEPEAPVVDQASVYEELYNLLQALWSGQRTVISPSTLVYTIWTALPSFKGYRQQDAQEFLSMFLDRLQSEMHGDSSTVQLNSRDFVNRTFQGHCVSHVRCANCNAITCTEEPFSELSLALPPECYNGESQECSLMDLMHQFVSATPIDGKGYACRECAVLHGPSNSITTPCSSASSTASPRGNGIFNLSEDSTPFTVDKVVSVALSRLPTPSSGPSSPTYRKACFRLPTPIHSPPSASFSTCNPKTNAGGDASDRSLGSSPSTPRDSKSALLCVDEHIQPPAQFTSATQTIRLTRLPRVLRLHIKRFRWIGRQREKLGCHVSFPLILDLSDFMLNDADRSECPQSHAHDSLHQYNDGGTTESAFPNDHRHLYHLTGVIVHHGRGFQSGHYTAYCLNDQPECWLSCNDANVTYCDYAEVASSQAYLLFYSELMPASPYPSWLKACDHPTLQARLKRCYSSAFAFTTDSTPQSTAIPSTPLSKDAPGLKRTVSTPSDLVASTPGPSSSTRRCVVAESPPKRDTKNRRAGASSTERGKSTS